MIRFGYPLPVLIPWKWKWPVGIFLWPGSLGLYCLTQLIDLREPQIWKLTSADLQIPFLPWTIWIYLSWFLFFPFVYAMNRSLIGLNQHLYSYTALILIQSLLFLFFPTRYPRELYPLTDDTLTHLIFHWIRQIDAPRHCFPSFHVSTVTLITLGFLDEKRNYLPGVTFWGSLMILSTLTTKQHYCYDILGGIILGATLFLIFHRLLRCQPQDSKT